MGIPLYGQSKQGGKIDDVLINSRNVWKFDRPPLVLDDGVLGGAQKVADGTAQDVTLHQYPSGAGSIYGLQLAASYNGTQAIDGPAPASTGMNYEGDEANNEGFQWAMSYPGSQGIEGVDSFTVGTVGFYAKLRYSNEDVSISDDCAFGFRLKSQASQANFDDYTDVASLNQISGDINVESILNNATTVTTDTTDNWGDAESHTLEVRISKAGVGSYRLDGRAVTTSPTADVTFDTGDVFTPFMFFLHSSAASCDIILQELETGLLDADGNPPK
jgi:hypothetical protein